ncbi:FHA domain-containing protein [Verrucomicrobium spinosum]|uniref:FHA domain-containing protein n=1 Tax=Verrucomicrobium spinosum TaxID=2736 RepID=UPI000ABEE016
MATLVFVLEDEREINVPLEGLITLGSSEDNDVVVDDATISAKHAVLEPSHQAVMCSAT